MLRPATFLLLAGVAVANRFCVDYGSVANVNLCSFNQRAKNVFVMVGRVCQAKRGCFPLGDTFATLVQCQNRCLNDFVPVTNQRGRVRGAVNTDTNTFVNRKNFVSGVTNTQGTHQGPFVSGVTNTQGNHQGLFVSGVTNQNPTVNFPAALNGYGNVNNKNYNSNKQGAFVSGVTNNQGNHQGHFVSGVTNHQGNHQGAFVSGVTNHHANHQGNFVSGVTNHQSNHKGPFVSGVTNHGNHQGPFVGGVTNQQPTVAFPAALRGYGNVNNKNFDANRGSFVSGVTNRNAIRTAAYVQQRGSPVGVNGGPITGPKEGKCGYGQRWTVCGSACPKVCGRPAALFCTQQCEVGCECKPGFVRVPGRKLRCIKKSNCPDFEGKSVSSASSESKSESNEQDDVCTLPMDMGNCPKNGYKKAFYFCTKSQRCKPFAFSGCGGNANRFRSLRRCQKACEYPAAQTSAESSESSESASSEEASAVNPCDDSPCGRTERCVYRSVVCVTTPCPQHRCLPKCPAFVPNPCTGKRCPGAKCERSADCRSAVFVRDGRNVTNQCRKSGF